MQKICVNIEQMERQSVRFEKVAMELNLTAQYVNHVRSSMNWNVSNARQIERILNQSVREIVELAVTIEKLGYCLKASSDRYQNTEQDIRCMAKEKPYTPKEYDKPTFIIKPNPGWKFFEPRILPFVGPGGILPHDIIKALFDENLLKVIGGEDIIKYVDDDAERNLFDDYRDTLKLIKSLTSIHIGDNKVGDDRSMIGSLFGFAEGALDVDGITSWKDYITYLTGNTGKGTDAASKLAKILGESDLSKELKVYSNVFGSVSLLSEFVGENWKDALTDKKLMGKVISHSEKLGQWIYKDYMNGTVDQAAKKELALYTTLMTMGVTAVSDVKSYYSDDGVYDVNDYGMTLLDTGVTGGSKLIKAASFGLVDIDGKGAVDTYVNNASWVAGKIKETGAPTAVQVIATIPASAAVAVYSTGEVIVDTAAETAKKVVNVGRFIIRLINK